MSLLDLNLQLPRAQTFDVTYPKPPQLNGFYDLGPKTFQEAAALTKKPGEIKTLSLSKQIKSLLDDLPGLVGDKTDLGRILGTLYSTGLSSSGSNLVNNIVKGQSLFTGLGENAKTSLAGAGVGLASNYIGKGIQELLKDSGVGRGVGQGFATGLGTIGGSVSNSIINGTDIMKDLKNINPYGFGMNVIGSGLSAGLGPSKEYEGTYGNITKGMDAAYDALQGAVSFVPGGGQVASGIMSLNKGLSNLFGSTSGMTKTDAILGSAFMPAPVKWLNMWGSSRTGKFNKQSWQNTERTTSFMQNAFGNLGTKFDLARNEQGKTYGTFSQDEKRKAQQNIDFSNWAWDKILAMTDQDEYQRIRSEAMDSINTQRYAQNIQGGWHPTLIGKQGMKILNNQTNHNIGQRLLSAAALIDNKQMILCQ